MIEVIRAWSEFTLPFTPASRRMTMMKVTRWSKKPARPASRS
ncbi:hypothetical protein JCM19238_1320 [Vibrio ponticus]|nr:hypothetical protein JCM19238_1320 [Vibrio ponticus]